MSPVPNRGQFGCRKDAGALGFRRIIFSLQTAPRPPSSPTDHNVPRTFTGQSLLVLGAVARIVSVGIPQKTSPCPAFVRRIDQPRRQGG